MCYVQVQLLCGPFDRIPQPPQRAMLEATGFRLLTYWQRTLVWLKPCRCSTEQFEGCLHSSACYDQLNLWKTLGLFPYPQAMVMTPPRASVPKTTNPLKIGWLSLKRVLNLTNACLTPLSVGSWYRQVGGWECGTGPLPAMHATNQLPSWFPQPVQSKPVGIALPGDIARAVMAQISRKRSMVDTAVPAQGIGDANNEGQLNGFLWNFNESPQ